MILYKQLINKKAKLAVIGLGYVGLPLAVAFSQRVEVIGFDLNKEKLNLYKSGIDPTQEIGSDILKSSDIYFTSDEYDLREANFHIVAVPTPINIDKTPDLSPVEKASVIIGRNLTKGSIVVYESTVYPGVTEDICIPILERESGMKCGIDFKVGYSPERINPGDKTNKLENIVKIVSGIDEESLEEIYNVYKLVINVDVYRAGSIKVAEAAKVVENSQRDINIAFMNELAMVFDRMGIDTKEVIDAMSTKWNFLNFSPGLVGGHCIGVDPYYFIYKAERLGYHSQIILSGRKINDGMAKFVSDAIIKQLIIANKLVSEAKIAILGVTFKENCPDIRNSRVVDIIKNLKEFGINPTIVDPYVSSEEALKEFGIEVVPLEEVSEMDCVVIAVAHNEFKHLDILDIDKAFKKVENKDKIIVDVKSIFNIEDLKQRGYKYWRL